MPKPNKGNGGGHTGAINGNKRDNVLTGTAASDVMDGKAGNDTQFGLGGGHTLLGGSGNDVLDGGQGNDSVTGGGGTDTAFFSGNRDDYAVISLGGGVIEISGPDGTDRFAEAELFQFADIAQTAAEVVMPRLANLSVDALSVDDTVLAPGETTSVSFQLASDGAADAGATSHALLLASAPKCRLGRQARPMVQACPASSVS